MIINLGICNDHDEMLVSRHNPEIGARYNIASRTFENAVQYCLITTPSGDELHFSATPDIENPDILR